MSDQTEIDKMPTPRPGRLRGRLDRADRTIITGWAIDDASPDEPVELEVLVDDEPAGTLFARVYREDLMRGGVGDADPGPGATGPALIEGSSWVGGQTFLPGS